MIMTCGADDVVVSASSITTVATTGSHMLKINGYSAKLAMRTGSHATSCEFEAAGHTWCILYYPNGFDGKVADHISLYLRLAGKVNSDVVVNARFRFSLVPHYCSDGGGGGAGGKKQPKPNCMSKPLLVPYHRQSVVGAFWRCMSMYGSTCGAPCFVRREVLEKSEYLVDESFAVRCDIDVLQTSAVSDLTVEPHDLFRLSLPCT